MDHNNTQKLARTFPTPFQKSVCWKALTGLSMLAIFLLGVGALLGITKILGYLEPVLLPVLMAGIIAYLLNPAVEWLERRHFSRLKAVLTVMLATTLLIVGFFFVIIPPLVQQTHDMIQNRKELWTSAASAFDDIIEKPSVAKAIKNLYEGSLREIQENPIVLQQEIGTFESADTPKEQLGVYLDLNSSFIAAKVFDWFTSGGKVVFSLVGICIGLVMTPIFVFYFLKESSSIQTKWHTLLPIKASKFKEEIVDVLQEINQYLIAFFRGQMLVSIIDGVLIGVALKIMGLPYAFTIGAAVAILGIIPYVGMIITVIPALLIAWFTWHDWQHLVGVVGIFIAMNQFDGWFIQPKVVGNSVGLHELTVMFSVLFWTLVLGGLLGALLAVPLTAAIKVIFRRYIWLTPKPVTDPSTNQSPPLSAT